MLTDSLSLILRSILLFISFCGLCEAIRNGLKIHRFIAPFVAGCGVVAVLMLSGMLRALSAGFWLLYGAGFAGCLYAWCVRRERPDLPMIGLLAAFALYLFWHFHGCRLSLNDDVSHWGLVARSIIDRDAFPGAATPTVKFQSYPVGAASFMYYLAKTTVNSEEVYLIAQSFLTGLGFLPLLAHIRANRRYICPVALVSFLFLLQRNHYDVTLQVDWLLPFLGFGAIAGILYYRDSLSRAVLVAFPFLISIVYIKNSGMYFAACAVVALVWIARANGLRSRRLAALALGGLAAFAGAYMLWGLHVKLSYPAGFDTKHAISADAYLEEISRKGISLALEIAGAMLAYLVRPNLHHYTGIAAMLLISASTVAGCLLIPGQRSQLRPVLRRLALCAGAYLLWYLLLYFMYLFSMPAGEAQKLASIARYNSTGLLYMLGLGVLTMFSFYGREGFVPGRTFRRFYAVCAAVCAALLIAIFPLTGAGRKLLRAEPGLVDVRLRLLDAREQLQMPDNSRIMVFYVNDAENRTYFHSYHHVKYAFNTADIVPLVCGQLDGNPETVYAHYEKGSKLQWLDDPMAFVAESINDCDAFILFDFEPEFDRQVREYLKTYDGDTPVIFAYPEG